MRLPDYGNGDWEVKSERNKMVPAIRNIGLEGNRIFAEFSHQARRIVVYGQNHATLHEVSNSSQIEYILGANEPYARIVAEFDEGEVIYTNPFARYDSTTAESPFREPMHSVDWVLTILFNTLIAIVAALIVVAIARLWRPKR
jgi:hypothetical protein